MSSSGSADDPICLEVTDNTPSTKPAPVTSQSPPQHPSRAYIISLPHPRYAPKQAKYLYIPSTHPSLPPRFLEIQKVENPDQETQGNSFFVQNFCIQDGAIYIATPINPLFLALPFLLGLNKAGNGGDDATSTLTSHLSKQRYFVPLSQVLGASATRNSSTALLLDLYSVKYNRSQPTVVDNSEGSSEKKDTKSTKGTRDTLAQVCDTVDVGSGGDDDDDADDVQYRVNEDKLMGYLLNKIKKIIKTMLKLQSNPPKVYEQYNNTNQQQQQQQQQGQVEDDIDVNRYPALLTSALQFVSEYLPRLVFVALCQRYNKDPTSVLGTATKGLGNSSSSLLSSSSSSSTPSLFSSDTPSFITGDRMPDVFNRKSDKEKSSANSTGGSSSSSKSGSSSSSSGSSSLLSKSSNPTLFSAGLSSKPTSTPPPPTSSTTTNNKASNNKTSGEGRNNGDGGSEDGRPSLDNSIWDDDAFGVSVFTKGNKEKTKGDKINQRNEDDTKNKDTSPKAADDEGNEDDNSDNDDKKKGKQGNGAGNSQGKGEEEDEEAEAAKIGSKRKVPPAPIWQQRAQAMKQKGNEGGVDTKPKSGGIFSYIVRKS